MILVKYDELFFLFDSLLLVMLLQLDDALSGRSSTDGDVDAKLLLASVAEAGGLRLLKGGRKRNGNGDGDGDGEFSLLRILLLLLFTPPPAAACLLDDEASVKDEISRFFFV